ADTVVLMDQGTIVQMGTPQQIYLKPSTAFAAEFLGVSNQLQGEVKNGQLIVAGQPLPYTGAVRGKATVIFRASDVQMEEPSASPRSGTAALHGILEESLFLGAHYRHYIRMGSVVVMADSPEVRPTGPVRLVLPCEKMQVYGSGEPRAGYPRDSVGG
ncbi:MAG TPA: hypothetical protein VN203_27600, partial [Candidatus Acidoferrum sp.]|nr:hypothetical protein [Candidatus Acidoferrum sp.]